MQTDNTKARILNADEIRAAREWIAECVWRDLDEDDIADLTDRQVERGIARHYDGGIEAFRADGL